MKLTEQIKLVAELRKAHENLVQQKRDSYEEWSKENKELIELLDKIAGNLNEEETQLREMTIEAYNETGNKQPVDGVGIREVKRLEYDSKKAFDWSMEHKICLQLDKKAFESMAKTASELKPGFVQIIPEPQATIATDLSNYLE